jgi:hypothetical protein
VSPGQRAYEPLRAAGLVSLEWSELSVEEQKTWDRGATMPPVGAVLDVVQEDSIKVA